MEIQFWDELSPMLWSCCNSVATDSHIFVVNGQLIAQFTCKSFLFFRQFLQNNIGHGEEEPE